MDYEDVEIPMPWGKVCGKWWGSKDRQPILFLHGWQDNCGSYDPLIQLLPKNLSYLCVDLPGHGLSSPYPAGSYYYIFWDELVVTRRIVKHFNWSKVSIVGHSLGGAVGFMYAAAYPDEVDKLVALDNVSPRVSSPKTLVNGFSRCIDNFLKYENLPTNHQPCHDPEEMMKIAEVGYKGSIGPEGLEVMLKRGMKVAPGCFEKFLFTRDVRLKVASLAMPSLDIVIEMAERIKCNYMNIRAVPYGLRLENPEVYPLILQILKRTCSTFHYYEVDGTHHVHLNDPDKVACFIAPFLAGETPPDSTPLTNGVNSSEIPSSSNQTSPPS